ncbi:PHD finger protein 10 isoform X4 [Melozone crissalis]|uniref:PHD finger protein 10 isoform X4 n=1 Tax=Melozone crissalis TaxID=40204 RepID=UPI0023DC4F79|nr:PHD finger protein 10 isoform X4 [Melozone crissalis]
MSKVKKPQDASGSAPTEGKAKSKSRNTYRLEPRTKVQDDLLQDKAQAILTNKLRYATYDGASSAFLCASISEEILNAVKELNYDRYKYVVSVLIVEKANQAMIVASRCLWDAQRDTWVSAKCETDTFIALALDDTEENSNDGSQPSKRRRMGSGDSSRSCETSSQDLGYSYFPAENLIEYKWPPDETGEYYMLQEQVSEYLGVTSFKRKYPDLERRDLSHKEKLYLRELNVITETQCTLGLTALRSDEVIDLMIKEYPAKHAEYSVILQEKERQRITDHYKEYSQMQQQNTQKVEASKVPEYIKKAAKKAAEFNSNLNRERMEERRAYFDLQTHIIQVPQGKYKVLPTERTKVSPYPVALIPGQFQEYYKRYSPDELRYLPLNTALYEPPLDPELLTLDSDGDSDDAEEGRGDEKRKTKGNSDNSSGNVSEGDCATDNQEDSFQGRQKTRDKSATPRKDGSKRSVLPKSVPGYKVEEKSP